MGKDSKPRSYALSEDVHNAIKELQAKYGSVDEGLRAVLFVNQLKAGDYALLGNMFECRVIARRDIGYYEVLLLEVNVRVVAYGEDLTLFEPTKAQLMKWKLTE